MSELTAPLNLAPEISVRPRGGAYLAAVTFIVLSLAVAVAATILPKFEAVFRDFKTPMPPLAQSELQFGRAVSQPLGLLVAIVVIAGFTWWSSRRWNRAMWSLVASLVLFFVVVGAIAMGMSGPLNVLIQNLQTSKP